MLACWASLASAGASQGPGRGTAAAPVAGGESDPIACWWKTDSVAVRVGQPFTLSVTCGVVDTPQLRVVADVDRLDASAIELAPFEVVGGTRHNDVDAPPRRFFQYSYTLRLLGDEYFGKDVDIPSLAITYNTESSGSAGVRGRDQLYLLPPLSVRVLSLVPIAATGIEDSLPDTFGDIDRTTFRSASELGAAGVLFLFAAVLAGVAVARAVRPHATRAASQPRVLTTPNVLRGCLEEAARVKSEAGRSGWTTDLIDRVLAVSRIAGSVALGRPVAQRAVDRGVAAREGQLTVRKRGLSATRVLISGSATAATTAATLGSSVGRIPSNSSVGRIPSNSSVGRVLLDPAGEGVPMDARVRITLDELSDSLRVLATARYGRGGDLDGPALDAALDTTTRALERLHAMTQWRARAGDKLSRVSARLSDIWDR